MSFRDRYPQYEDLSDDQLASALERVREQSYSDVEPTKFYEVIGFQPQQEKGFLDSAAETGRDLSMSAVGGAGSLINLGGSLYGLATGDMDNKATRFGGMLRGIADIQKSDDLNARERARTQKIAEAESPLGKAGVAFWETVKDPMLFSSFVAEQSPMLIPGLAVGRGTGLIAKAMGAGPKLAGATATGGAIGAGTALSAGDAGSSAYQQLMGLPDEMWEQHPQIQDAKASGASDEQIQALKEQVATSLSRDAATATGAVSLLTNLIPGARKLEQALGGAGAARGAVSGFLGEAAQEAIEEAVTQATANLATRQVDPSQAIAEGVGEAAGMGAVGGVFGGVAGLTGKQADIKPPASVLSAGTVEEAISAAAQELETAETDVGKALDEQQRTNLEEQIERFQRPTDEFDATFNALLNAEGGVDAEVQAAFDRGEITSPDSLKEWLAQRTVPEAPVEAQEPVVEPALEAALPRAEAAVAPLEPAAEAAPEPVLPGVEPAVEPLPPGTESALEPGLRGTEAVVEPQMPGAEVAAAPPSLRETTLEKLANLRAMDPRLKRAEYESDLRSIREELPKDASRKLDPTRDDVMTAIRKVGGLNREEAISQLGIDPADMRRAAPGTFRREGRNLDDLRETLAQDGYPVEMSEFQEAIASTLRGQPVYSVAKQEGPPVEGLGKPSEIRKAIDKAIARKNMGPRQQEIVRALLDRHTDERMRMVGEARERLEQTRLVRRGDVYEPALDPEEYSNEFGEADPEGQATLDAMEALDDLDIDPLPGLVENNVESTLDSFDALLEKAYGRPIEGRGLGEGDVSEEQGARPEAGEAFDLTEQTQPEVTPPRQEEQQDLLGEDTRTAQAIADRERAQDEKRSSGETDLTGTMFGQDRQQADLTDEAAPPIEFPKPSAETKQRAKERIKASREARQFKKPEQQQRAPASRGTSREAVQRAIADINVPEGVTVQILPFSKASPEAQNATGAGRSVRGSLRGSTITLFYDNIPNARAARVTLAHELYGHLGPNRIIGDRWDEVVGAYQSLKKRPSARFKEIFSDLQSRYGQLDPETEVKEFIALAAERRVTEGTIGRFMRQVREAVKAGLRRMGFRQPFSMGDVDLILSAGERAMEADVAQDQEEQFDISPTDTRFDVLPESWFDIFVRKMQDKVRPLERVQKAIAKAKGPIPQDQDAYLKQELLFGRTENRLREFEENHVNPLVEAMAKQGVSQFELDVFLYAKHAPERNAHIAEINPSMPDGGSGMTNAQAKAVLDKAREIGRYDVLESLAKRVYAINKMRLTVLKNGELESDETLDAWQKYDFYVPLKGQVGEKTVLQRIGKGFDIRGKESLRALGRRTLAESPLLHSIAQFEESVVRTEKARVGRAFLKLVKDNPNPDYWEVFEPGEAEMIRRYNPKTREVEVVPNHAMARDPSMLSVKVQGQQHYIKLHDERLLRAMKNLGPEALNAFLRVMAKSVRALAMLSTSLNPEFMVGNAPRDIQTAIVNIVAQQDIGPIKGKRLAAAIVKDVPKAMRGAYRGLRGKGEPTEWQQHFEEYRKAGGKIGFFGLRDLEQRAADLRSLILEASGGKVGKLMKVKTELFKFVDDMNSAVENGVRLSTFVHARRAGLSTEKAASLARNLTVDFNKRGELGVLANSLYMFANASVQGSTVVLKSLKSRKVRMIAAGAVAVSMALAELNRMLGGDDEDDEPRWNDVPDHVKERNLVVMNPTDVGPAYFTFPLPYGYNVFMVLGNLANDLAHGDKSVQEAASVFAAAVMGSFNPIGLESSDEAAKAVLKTVSPTVLTPIAQLAVNENFYGGRIYRENNPFSPPRPDSALTTRYSQEPFIAIAEFMNRATGGSDEVSGTIDVNPDSIKHLWQFATGGAGATVSRSLGLVDRVISGKEIPPREIPFVRRVFGELTDTPDRQRFFDRRDQIEQHYRQLIELDDPERRAYVQEHPEIRLRPLVKSMERRFRLYYEARDAIEGSGRADEERILERIEEDERMILDKFNKKYREVSGRP